MTSGSRSPGSPVSLSPQDASSIIGMRSRWAALVVVGFVIAAAVVTFGSPGTAAPAPAFAVALALLAGGAAMLLVIPGDPMPASASAVLAAIPAIQVAVVYPNMPVPFTATLPLAATVGGGVMLCAFLCVRGRVLYAWLGQAAAFTVAGLTVAGVHGDRRWASSGNEGWGITLGMFGSNAAILVMATCFAYLIRPAIAALYRLRDVETRIAAERAAAEATRIEQATQKARLDHWARPLLASIADGQPLDAADVERAGLVEALLRDAIRARVLDEPVIRRAAWRARRRGVSVSLLDDGGLDAVGLSTSARTRLFAELAACLDAAGSGSVTIRVQPPNRAEVVTLVAVAGDDVVSRAWSHLGVEAPFEAAVVDAPAVGGQPPVVDVPEPDEGGVFRGQHRVQTQGPRRRGVVVHGDVDVAE